MGAGHSRHKSQLFSSLGSPETRRLREFPEAPMRPQIPLPRSWNRRAKSAILHILALSHYAFTALLARALEHADLCVGSMASRIASSC